LARDVQNKIAEGAGAINREQNRRWGGYSFHYWLDESNAWVYRHLHKAGERMVELADRHPSATGIMKRALNQAARELMLMQSSDWAFIMRTGTTVSYATRRMNEHVLRFNRLYDGIMAGRVTERLVAEVEARDNVFPDLDYRVYASWPHDRPTEGSDPRRPR
jgi:1,4-alpha-glucan branching enzyme